jgi:hypothetical protein
VALGDTLVLPSADGTPADVLFRRLIGQTFASIVVVVGNDANASSSATLADQRAAAFNTALNAPDWQVVWAQSATALAPALPLLKGDPTRLPLLATAQAFSLLPGGTVADVVAAGDDPPDPLRIITLFAAAARA